jgi:hypothetical protein
MKDGKPNDSSDPDYRRSASAGRRGGGAPRKRGFVERATANGHSGYGADSVRPHLRDQLKLKSLLPQPFPTPPEHQASEPAKDEHHR